MLENIMALEAKLSMKNQELDAVKGQCEQKIISLKTEQVNEITLLKQQKDMEIASMKHKNEQEIAFLKQGQTHELAQLEQQKDMEIASIKHKTEQEINSLKAEKDKEISTLNIEKDKEISELKKLAHCDKKIDVVGSTQPVKVKKNSLFLELVHMTCDFNKVKKEKDTAKYNADKVKREQLNMTKTIEDLQRMLENQQKEKVSAKHHVDMLEKEQLGMTKTIEELKQVLVEQRKDLETCKQENEILHHLKEELLLDRTAFQQKCVDLKKLLINARRK